METVLTRFPKGAPLSHRIDLDRNPDRVIYRPEANGEVTYMGTLTHAGIESQNLPRGSFIQARER